MQDRKVQNQRYYARYVAYYVFGRSPNLPVICVIMSRPTQPPTLSGTGLSTGQRAVMLCGWE